VLTTWHLLTAEEQRTFGAPPAVDGLGVAVIVSAGRWDGDALIMLMSGFIDESGAGDEPVLLMGAIIAPALEWHGFSVAWQALLDDEAAPYAHYFEMDRNEGPFENWGVAKKARFLQGQYPILNAHCKLGLTVSLNKDLYNEVYRKDFPKRASPDSAYGVCAKELIVQAHRLTRRHFGEGTDLNLVIEEGHPNLPNVVEIVQDIKRCYPEHRYGPLIPMEKRKALPLQAIDQLAVACRRYEPTAIRDDLFATTPPEATMEEICLSLAEGERFPIFYVSLDQERLHLHRKAKAEIARIKRAQKRHSKRGLLS